LLWEEKADQRSKPSSEHQVGESQRQPAECQWSTAPARFNGLGVQGEPRNALAVADRRLATEASGTSGQGEDDRNATRAALDRHPHHEERIEDDKDQKPNQQGGEAPEESLATPELTQGLARVELDRYRN